MDKQKLFIIGALVIGLVCGFFLGREHLKYEIRSNIEQAITGFGEGLKNIFGEDKDIESEPNGKLVESIAYQKKADYIQNFLEIYVVKAKYEELFGVRKAATVAGKIKNTANRSIKVLKFTA